mgnify:CR=1 FL=1
MAGSHAVKAADASAEWAVTNTKVAVINAYYGAVLMAEKVKTLEAALKAAEAHVRQAEQMVKAGLATRSDALLASVKAGEIRTLLLEARAAGAKIVFVDEAHFAEIKDFVAAANEQVRNRARLQAIDVVARDAREHLVDGEVGIGAIALVPGQPFERHGGFQRVAVEQGRGAYENQEEGNSVFKCIHFFSNYHFYNASQSQINTEQE